MHLPRATNERASRTYPGHACYIAHCPNGSISLDDTFDQSKHDETGNELNKIALVLQQMSVGVTAPGFSLSPHLPRPGPTCVTRGVSLDDLRCETCRLHASEARRSSLQPVPGRTRLVQWSRANPLTLLTPHSLMASNESDLSDP